MSTTSKSFKYVFIFLLIILIKVSSIYSYRSQEYRRYKKIKSYIKKSIAFVPKNKIDSGFTYYRKALRLYKKRLGRYKKYVRLYKFGRALYKAGKYKLAVKALKMLPKRQRITYATYILARSYEKQKKYSKASYLFKGLLNKRGKAKTYASYAASRLLSIWYKHSNYYKIKLYHKKLLSLIRRMKRKSLYWARYRIIRALSNYAFSMVAKSRMRRAFSSMSSAARLNRLPLGKYRRYIKSGDFDIERKALFYWARKRRLKKHSYKHKVLIIVMKNIDAVWRDKKGNLKHTINKISKKEIDAYSDSFNYMKILVYYLSRARIRLEFKQLIHPGKIKRMKRGRFLSKARQKNGQYVENISYYTPDFTAGKGYPSNLIYKYRNWMDTLMFIYPSKGITRTSTGGWTLPWVVPGYIKLQSRRGLLTIANVSLKKRARLLVHEFFHSVEGAYYKSHKNLPHVFRKHYKPYWPRWYRGGGEYFYYDGFFRRYVLRDGARRLRYRRDKDYTSLKKYKKMNKRYLGKNDYKINVTPSGNLAKQAFKAYRKQKYKKAVQLYKKYFKKFKPKNYMYLWYGFSLNKIYRYKEAVRMLTKYLSGAGSSQYASSALLSIANILVKKTRNYKQATKLIPRYWKSRSRNKKWGECAYYLGQAFMELEQYKKAKLWFNRARSKRSISNRMYRRYMQRIADNE